MNTSEEFPQPSNLLQELDKRIMVWLRDGRTLVGTLRSVDQFANLVIHQAVERIHVETEYGDIPRGIFLIRGENVALLGTIDLQKEPPANLRKVTIPEILNVQETHQQLKTEKQKSLSRLFKKKGILYSPADSLLEQM